MAKFKLVQKVNPQKRNEPARWFAIPKIVARMTTRAVCKYVTRNTTNIREGLYSLRIFKTRSNGHFRNIYFPGNIT